MKTGRNQLLDARPSRMDQSLSAWSEQIKGNMEALKALEPQLQQLAQGGTAVGTGVNAHPDFAHQFCQVLNVQTGAAF